MENVTGVLWTLLTYSVEVGGAVIYVTCMLAYGQACVSNMAGGIYALAPLADRLWKLIFCKFGCPRVVILELVVLGDATWFGRRTNPGGIMGTGDLPKPSKSRDVLERGSADDWRLWSNEQDIPRLAKGDGV